MVTRTPGQPDTEAWLVAHPVGLPGVAALRRDVDVVHNAASVLVPDQILIEKRKWDGSVASREVATLVRSKRGALVWLVEPGRTRLKPRQRTLELVSPPEVWVASPTMGSLPAPAPEQTTRSTPSRYTPPCCPGHALARSSFGSTSTSTSAGPGRPHRLARRLQEHIRRWDEMHYPEQLVRKAWDAIGEALTRIQRATGPSTELRSTGREARAKTSDAEGAHGVTRRAAWVARLVGGHIVLHSVRS